LLLQLKKRYGNHYPVGMGGVFAIKAGMVKAVCMIWPAWWQVYITLDKCHAMFGVILSNLGDDVDMSRTIIITLVTSQQTCR
jgi:hypothetical protein